MTKNLRETLQTLQNTLKTKLKKEELIMTKLQKTLSTILTAGVLLASMPMASAAEVQTDDIQLYEGDKIIYSMLMPETGYDTILCLQCAMYYDGDKIEFESFDWNNRVEKAEANLYSYCPNYFQREDIYTVRFVASSPYSYEFPAGEEIATLTFTVKEDMMLSEAELENCIEVMGSEDDSEYGITETYEDKPTDSTTEVELVNINHKDVTGDGRVNVMDATAIQKHIALIDILSADNLSRADVNNDGIVNIKDATDLQLSISKA